MTKNNLEGERLARVETNLENLKLQNNSIESKLDKFIDSAESKFASKLTERIVYGLVTLVLVAVMSKLLKYW